MTLTEEKGFTAIVYETKGFCEPWTRVNGVSKIYGVNNRKTELYLQSLFNIHRWRMLARSRREY